MTGVQTCALPIYSESVLMKKALAGVSAKHLGKNAATILTVSDIIPTHENISADQREKALKPMIELALEAGIKSL